MIINISHILHICTRLEAKWLSTSIVVIRITKTISNLAISQWFYHQIDNQLCNVIRILLRFNSLGCLRAWHSKLGSGKWKKARTCTLQVSSAQDYMYNAIGKCIFPYLDKKCYIQKSISRFTGWYVIWPNIKYHTLEIHDNIFGYQIAKNYFTTDINRYIKAQGMVSFLKMPTKHPTFSRHRCLLWILSMIFAPPS